MKKFTPVSSDPAADALLDDFADELDAMRGEDDEEEMLGGLLDDNQIDSSATKTTSRVGIAEPYKPGVEKKVLKDGELLEDEDDDVVEQTPAVKHFN